VKLEQKCDTTEKAKLEKAWQKCTFAPLCQITPEAKLVENYTLVKYLMA
jgi:hypothetical protein